MWIFCGNYFIILCAGGIIGDTLNYITLGKCNYNNYDNTNKINKIINEKTI